MWIILSGYIHFALRLQVCTCVVLLLPRQIAVSGLAVVQQPVALPYPT